MGEAKRYTLLHDSIVLPELVGTGPKGTTLLQDSRMYWPLRDDEKSAFARAVEDGDVCACCGAEVKGKTGLEDEVEHGHGANEEDEAERDASSSEGWDTDDDHSGEDDDSDEEDDDEEQSDNEADFGFNDFDELSDVDNCELFDVDRPDMDPLLLSYWMFTTITMNKKIARAAAKMAGEEK